MVTYPNKLSAAGGVPAFAPIWYCKIEPLAPVHGLGGNGFQFIPV